METRDFYLRKTFLFWKIKSYQNIEGKKHEKMLIESCFILFVYY